MTATLSRSCGSDRHPSIWNPCFGPWTEKSRFSCCNGWKGKVNIKMIKLGAGHLTVFFLQRRSTVLEYWYPSGFIRGMMCHSNFSNTLFDLKLFYEWILLWYWGQDVQEPWGTFAPHWYCALWVFRVRDIRKDDIPTHLYNCSIYIHAKKQWYSSWYAAFPTFYSVLTLIFFCSPETLLFRFRRIHCP